jgi:hypothetical protein
MSELWHVELFFPLSASFGEPVSLGARNVFRAALPSRDPGAEFSLSDIAKVARASTGQVRQAARRMHFDVENLDGEERFFSGAMAERLLREVATGIAERNAVSR